MFSSKIKMSGLLSLPLMLLAATGICAADDKPELLANTTVCTDSTKFIVVQSHYDPATKFSKTLRFGRSEELGDKFHYFLGRYKTLSKRSTNGITIETGEAEQLSLIDRDNNWYKGDKVYCTKVTVEKTGS